MAGGASSGFPSLVPTRSLGLRDAGAAPEPGPDVRRLRIADEVLAQVIRQRGGDAQAWGRLRADVWDRAFRDAHLDAALEILGNEVPSTPVEGALAAIRDRLAAVRALEARLGEDAEEEAMRPQRDFEAWTVLGSLLAVAISASPAGIRAVLAGAAAVVGARAAWRLWGPKVRVERTHLVESRRALARAVQAFLEQTWVVELGDAVLESTPHAVYLEHRLVDLDAAHGARLREIQDLRGLIQRIRATNRALGNAETDAETERLERQVEDVAARMAQVERLRADWAAQLEAHRAQLDRRRAIAARRALSSRVSQVVEAEAEGAADDLALLEVDVAEMSARLRALDVEIGSADAELRAVLEVSASVVSGRRPRGDLGTRRSPRPASIPRAP